MNGNSKYGVEVDVESVGEGSEVDLNQREIRMAHDGSVGQADGRVIGMGGMVRAFG